MQTSYPDLKKNVSILVVSCDAYEDLWTPFFRCFFKYWPDCPYPLYLGANFRTYLDEKVKNISVGVDVDYSSNLIKMLSQIETEWVILWIEDRVLCSPVDTERIKKLIKDAQTDGAAFVKLIASYPYSILSNGTLEIGEISKGTKYRVCMTVALWNKHILLKLLRPGETAWLIERNGSLRSNSYQEKFYGLLFKFRNIPPITDQHLIIKGKLVRDSISFLKQENLYGHLQGRLIQTLPSYLYVKVYLMYWWLRTYWVNSRKII